MEDYYEDYLEDVIEIADKQFDISKEEIIYNSEHFEQCFEDGTDPEHAVFLLSNFCI